MPIVNYTGTQGVVQSGGTDQFLISGSGLLQPVESITAAGGNAAGSTAVSAFGVTNITIPGDAKHVKVANPTSVAADQQLFAGLQKVIVATVDQGGSAVINTEQANGVATLDTVKEYVLLIWTGSDWALAAKKV